MKTLPNYFQASDEMKYLPSQRNAWVRKEPKKLFICLELRQKIGLAAIFKWMYPEFFPLSGHLFLQVSKLNLKTTKLISKYQVLYFIFTYNLFIFTLNFGNFQINTSFRGQNEWLLLEHDRVV